MSIYQAVSSNKEQCILLGYSGHGYVVTEAALLAGISILGYAESMRKTHNPFAINYLGDETHEDFDWQTHKHYLLGVGSNKIRAQLARRVRWNGGSCLRVIHPSAALAKTAHVGQGTFVARNAAVNPLVEIGENVILNTSCSIDHECRVGDNVHIAPGAVLAGNVNIGDGALIGANSVITEGVTIGKHAIIGAGSVVITDVADNQVFFGNPAKPKNRK